MSTLVWHFLRRTITKTNGASLNNWANPNQARLDGSLESFHSILVLMCMKFPVGQRLKPWLSSQSTAFRTSKKALVWRHMPPPPKKKKNSQMTDKTRLKQATHYARIIFDNTDRRRKSLHQWLNSETKFFLSHQLKFTDRVLLFFSPISAIVADAGQGNRAVSPATVFGQLRLNSASTSAGHVAVATTVKKSIRMF